jgi:hypothetical protein
MRFDSSPGSVRTTEQEVGRMIGTLEEATEICTLIPVGVGFTQAMTVKKRVEGTKWTYLGCGWSRFAFLSPSGVVYKVPTAQGRKAMNEAEHQNAQRLRESQENHVRSLLDEGEIYVPETHYFPNGILAMEYAGHLSGGAGGQERFYRAIEQVMNVLRIGDMHGGNLMYDRDNDRFVLVDLGSSYD